MSDVTITVRIFSILLNRHGFLSKPDQLLELACSVFTVQGGFAGLSLRHQLRSGSPNNPNITFTVALDKGQEVSIVLVAIEA